MDKKHSQTMRIDIPPELLAHPKGAKPAAESASDKAATATPPSGHTPQPIGDPDFQRLFQSVYDAAVIAETSGLVADANPRAVDFLQRPRDELCRLSILDVISGADQSVLRTLRESLQSDRFILIQAYCVRRDGTLFPTEIAVNRLQTAGREYLCFFVRDVTVRRQAEEMLQTIHNAIQNAGTGIAIAGLDGKLQYVNLAAVHLCGFDGPEAMQGLALRSLFKDGRQAVDIEKAIASGHDWTGELVLQRTDGREVHVQLSVAGNYDADEHLVGMVVSFVDISDRKRAEEAERQAERQQVMMESLGAACHHLGQPSTILLSSLELISRMKDKDRAAVDELLSSSLAAAESLRRMLHDLNEMTEYRTVPYVEGSGKDGSGKTRIIAI